jgi:Uncharacterized conserved domain (SAYSvFN)
MVRSSTERSNIFFAGVVLWIVACWWMISNDLGSIAFVGSVLLAIWRFGLRDKFDGEEGDSAYNVFNQGGRAILGSLTGEQVDQQMRGGMTYQKKEVKVSSDAPLTTTTVAASPSKLSDNEKVKRRAAAAAAAQRRMEQQTAQEQAENNNSFD